MLVKEKAQTASVSMNFGVGLMYFVINVSPSDILCLHRFVVLLDYMFYSQIKLIVENEMWLCGQVIDNNW